MALLFVTLFTSTSVFAFQHTYYMRYWIRSHGHVVEFLSNDVFREEFEQAGVVFAELFSEIIPEGVSQAELLGGGPDGVTGGLAGGVPGGVLGGVAGGEVGGVLGGVLGGDLSAVGPFWAGGAITAPRVIERVQPAYPPLARHVRLDGFRPGKAPRKLLVEDPARTGTPTRTARGGPRHGSIDAGLPSDANAIYGSGVPFCGSWQPTQERTSPGMAVNQLRINCTAFPSSSSG